MSQREINRGGAGGRMAKQIRARVGARIVGLAICAGLVALGPALAALAQSDNFNEEPIRYAKSQPTDPVAQLQARIERGEVTLTRDRVRGYLPSVLKQLGVPASSQMLVFSKTSFQRDLISPVTPRAIYFNDRT